jgi:hypothetical protein
LRFFILIFLRPGLDRGTPGSIVRVFGASAWRSRAGLFALMSADRCLAIPNAQTHPHHFIVTALKLHHTHAVGKTGVVRTRSLGWWSNAFTALGGSDYQPDNHQNGNNRSDLPSSESPLVFEQSHGFLLYE